MNDTTQLISTFDTLMAANNYPVVSPVNPNVMADLLRKAPPLEWDATKKVVYEDKR